MKKKMKNLRRFFFNKDGASAIEYGLIAALVAVGIIIAITFLGTENTKLHDTTAQKVKQVVQDANFN